MKRKLTVWEHLHSGAYQLHTHVWHVDARRGIADHGRCVSHGETRAPSPQPVRQHGVLKVASPPRDQIGGELGRAPDPIPFRQHDAVEIDLFEFVLDNSPRLLLPHSLSVLGKLFHGMLAEPFTPVVIKLCDA